MRRISRYFINGLMVIVPIAITVLVTVEIFNFTEGILGEHLPVYFPGLGLLTVLAMILITGWLSSYWIMQKMIGFGEWIVVRIPVVKFIYNSVKHLSSAVFESNNLFKEVVMVPYPHEGVRAIGFIMSELPDTITDHLPAEHVCVFVPWSLNMTSGVNIIVPKKDVIYLDISNEAALQYALTAGMVMPPNKKIS